MFRLEGDNFEWLDTVSTPKGRVVDISADGTTVVGQHGRAPYRGYRWTREAGVTDIGEIYPLSTSGDGSIVTGLTKIWESGSIISFSDLLRRENIDIEVDGRGILVSDDGVTFTARSLRHETYFLRLGEYEACDLNADASCDASDIDAMANIPERIVRSAFDLDSDKLHTQEDRRIWVEELMNTNFGDTDLDGRFSTSDLLFVLDGRHYESGGTNPGWLGGDWNGDLRFDSFDIILAFQSGKFESQQFPAAVVPEPNPRMFLTLVLLLRRRFSSDDKCFNS